MELIKEKWCKKDIKEFQEYLKTYENKEKLEWSKNILQTQLPVLCMTTKDMKYVIENIAKGNYLSFIDLMIWEYYENTSIIGTLICKIKDFDTKKKYLDIYSKKADNWATCDLLKFDIEGNEEKYFSMSQEYVLSNEPFVRRIGLYILFNYLDKDEYIDSVFETIDKFTDENHYYVNMMLGWLLSECFIKQRKKTLKYLAKNNLNRIALNKSIQKCRESRRVNVEDKDMLLSYKAQKISKKGNE